MTAVTAEMVRDLRERTGAGMMDCKKALTESGGDKEAAIDYLRKKGLAAAAKKAGRAATEGLSWVVVTDGGKKMAAVEVNCETDFVAKNEDFVHFVKEVGELAVQDEKLSLETVLQRPYPGKLFKFSGTVQEALTALVAKIGENMSLRRIKTYHAKAGEALGSYIHGAGKVAVMARARMKDPSKATAGAGAQLLKDVCMQVAAAKPEFLEPKEVTPERLEREKAIYMQQAMDSGKPREIAEKMVTGKLQKLYGELCLLQQPFVKEPEFTVEKVLQRFNKEQQESVTLVEFVRFALGEGLEKKSDDFAAEVAALQKS